MISAFAMSVMVQAAPVSLVPMPNSVVNKPGYFVLSHSTRVYAPEELSSVGDLLRSYLSPGTGLELPIASRPIAGAIELRLDPSLSRLGPEGYKLSVTPNGARIASLTPAGVFYGVQTFRQLLSADSFRKAPIGRRTWAAPCVEIEDKPRFSWRGGHIDVGRHFMPKEFLLKFVDLLAMHKLNVMHLHLTEDQGWRVEIKRYPRLTQIGAWRKDTMLTYSPPTFTGKPHGGFYTQDDLRELVAYAAKRFITVVPEIEMPGHAQAAIAAYPELGNTGAQLEIATKWGVMESVFNVEDSTIQFLQNVLDEVMAIFPSTFIHIGGDECPKKEWKESAKAQAKMKMLGLKDEHELQSWFIKQMDAFLVSRGRRLVGWDEILEGGLAPGATVMSWRGMAGGVEAARLGHDVVMAPTDFTYFDYYQSSDRAKEPHAIGGHLPIEKVYTFEPVPSELTDAQAKRILGAQFQLWSEYIPNPKHMEYMMFPRACALAEVVWSSKESRDSKRFFATLPFHLERLGNLDVNFRRLDGGD